jgi:alanyl-tRNA synthetase
MKANEIRSKFLNFFKENGHDVIESSPLIPQNDPTLLFANAGMNQFKDYFTGKANAKNPKATTAQKCVRAGGKHNDLENVGFTARHHTFFEMLGNFSFGDYFKKEAINYAWTFLTQELKIPKDKLYITVHDSDQEAADIWHEQEGIPRDRIFFMGDKDNFWEMGDIGPCGPCSEIFYDHGEKYSDGADTSECILADEGRYVEIWNLVFMQYEKYKDGEEIKRRNLPKPSVDTGAGLERIAALMQGVYWNYDSDAFTPIMNAIEKLSGKKYSDSKYQSSFRVIADHIRSCTMLITDGVIPSNEGRGYVLRRIIRRAVRHLEELGLTDVSFYKLIPSVFESLGDQYPENKANDALAEKLLKVEEEKFRQTLKTGLELIKKEMKNFKKGSLFSGETAFKLYDTYGFPLDLTEVILKENEIQVDIEGFDKAMEEQKAKSKGASKFAAAEDNIEQFYAIKEKYGETVFKGYETTTCTAKLINTSDQGEYTALIFDQTPFYGESGGQMGDEGKILALGKLMSHMDLEVTLAEVVDTQKPVEGLFVHYCKNVKKEALEIGAEYELMVNSHSRNMTTKHHSATHLLQAALIEILGDHVKQAGSSVSYDRLRFDFTHTDSLSQEQIEKVEKLVNKKIQESLPVKAAIMNKDEATKLGAMALFGEKYGDEVRVLQMGDFSVELCGGTHVKNTHEIGSFLIISESSLSSGVRRIEALVGEAAFNYLNKRSHILSKLERSLSAKEDSVITKVENLQSDIKAKSKEIKDLNDQLQASKGKELFNSVKDIGKDFGFVIVNLKDGSPKEFRILSDKFVDNNNKDVALIYTLEKDKFSYILRTHKNNKKIHCSNIIKEAQTMVSGRGGGRPDMAQGSGETTDPNAFIEKVESLLKEI